MTARRSGLLGVALAILALAAAGYLSVVELAGGLPACGPIRGCETVAQSEYSRVAGIPVALLGVAFSATVLGLQLAWWKRGLRTALVAAYALGLFGVILVAYLTYLELFVIGAVCVWCVTYAVAVVAGWVVAAAAMRTSEAPVP